MKIGSDINAFVRELDLVRLNRNDFMVAWVEDNGHMSDCKLKMQRIRGKKFGEPIEVAIGDGIPANPKTCGSSLLWIEFENATGTLMHAAVDADKTVVAPAKPVALLKNCNCGDFACTKDVEGRIWVMCEIWRTQTVALRVIVMENNAWSILGEFGANGICLRPRLACDGNRVMAVWDEFGNDGYSIRTVELDNNSTREDRVRTLPKPSGSWETLATVEKSYDGKWYVARCRERIVVTEHGEVTHHSEICVAVRDDNGEWSDIASVNIDNNLNPPVSAYCGRLRFANLVPDKKGVWLIWEEQQELSDRGDGHWPHHGRLCGMRIDEKDTASKPVIIMSGCNRCIVAANSEADDLLVASKTQLVPRQQRLPYMLHRMNPDICDKSNIRPDNLENNAALPDFVSPCSPEKRPRLKVEGLELFFGDIHVHTRLSGDLAGEQDEAYAFARHVAGIDFMAVCENDFHWYVEPFSPADWQRSIRNAKFFNRPGKFSSLLGWEYTLHTVMDKNDITGYSYTHRCVLSPGNDNQRYSWFEGSVPTPQDLTRRLQGQRLLMHPHHDRSFDISDDELERNIEICSGWQNYMLNSEYRYQLHELLKRGVRLGFFGASDNHNRNPGLAGPIAGVWATENTREAIFDALWNRRVFASSGIRPELCLKVSGTMMGSSGNTDELPEIELLLRSDVPVARVELIRDGECVKTFNGGETFEPLKWRDENCAKGEHFYYVHVLFEGEEACLHGNSAPACGVHAWTSPVWIEVC